MKPGRCVQSKTDSAAAWQSTWCEKSWKNYLYQKFSNLYPLAMELSYKFALKYLLFDRECIEAKNIENLKH